MNKYAFPLMIVAALGLGVLIPGAEQPSGENRCAVACRCPCARGGPCCCEDRTCPVDVCLTGSDHERAWVPGDCLRRKRIPCLVEATAR